MPMRPTGLIPPFLDLGEAIHAVEKIHEKGGGSLNKVTLAGEMKYSVNSSSFILRVGNLKQYGLVTEEAGSIHLTQLGMQLAAPTSEDDKKILVEVLHRIPVFHFLHDRFADKNLPSESDLQNILIREKSIEKSNASKWVNKFIASASAAKIITNSNGKDVLLKEPLSQRTSISSPSDTKSVPISSMPKEKDPDKSYISIPCKNGIAEISLPAQSSDADIAKIIKVLEALKSGDQG